MGASILLASKVSIDLQFGMFFSTKNLCVAVLYACAAFGVHAEGALSPVGCYDFDDGDSVLIKVDAGSDPCSYYGNHAVTIELNKVDGFRDDGWGGMKCDSDDGWFYSSLRKTCNAARDALNKFDGIDKVETGVGYNIVFSFSFIVVAMQM